jgi:Phage protein Gp138 N-terminal domain
MGTGNFYPPIEQRLNPSVARSQQLTDVIMQSLRVCLPGIVQSFDPATCTVSVQIATQYFSQQNTATQPYLLSITTKTLKWPLLTHVPISFYTAGAYNVTLPIQIGDECLVFFADTELDIWFQNGGENNVPLSQRRHDLSDAIAVFGLRSTPVVLSNYSTDSMQLRDDDSTVVIDISTTNGVTITAPKVTVNATGDIDMTAGGDITIAATGQVSISSGGNNTQIDSIEYVPHVHDGVTPGASNTGPVVP